MIKFEHIAILLILFLAINSCKHKQDKRAKLEPPTSAPEAATDPHDFSNMKIILVLAGLDARGFANIGALRALEKNHIFPSKIIATGMGALTASFYCVEKNSFSVEWKHFKLGKDIYFDFSLFGGKLGKISPKRLLKFSKENLGVNNFSDLQLPLTIVTSDLKSGEPYLISEGSLHEAIYAAISIPGIFAPIRFRNRLLMSGYLTSGLPIEIALGEEADAIIAIELEDQRAHGRLDTLTKLNLRTLKMAGFGSYEKFKKNKKVFVVKPNLSSFKSMQFDNKKIIMNVGFHAVNSVADELKAFLSEIRVRD